MDRYRFIDRSFSPMASESPSAVRKVVIHLRATGDAPILKQQKFKVSGTDKFASVIDFLRRQLHKDTLFVYINSAFSPNPDESVIDLYNKWVLVGWAMAVACGVDLTGQLVHELNLLSNWLTSTLNAFGVSLVFCCGKRT